jgi:DNA-binding beta-propeller fold protein YncE
MTVAWSCSEQSSSETTASQTSEATESNLAPTAFEVDPFWPKQLPNNWILGDVAGIATDANDHVWIVQRPSSLHERETGAMKNPPEAECCAAAPSVMEFDTEGNLLRAWGNPDTTKAWITVEHGIFIDQQANVWIGGAANDHVVMKFTADGQPLLQIGQLGQTNGSNDTTLLGSPADMFVDAKANEVYIADGYRNKRVVVFDATTGQYKRHWGAYGNPPSDDELAPYSPAAQPLKGFRNAVHAVIIANDNLMYVADRMNDRIQVFNKDGSFVKEARLAPQTLGTGSVWDFELSPDPAQTYLYVADGMNMKIWILNRSTLEVVGTLGHGGRNAGQFGWLHNIAMDSKGNLYTAEVTPGKRIQKFASVVKD